MYGKTFFFVRIDVHLSARWRGELERDKANSHKLRALSTINVFSNCTLKLYFLHILSNCTFKWL